MQMADIVIAAIVLALCIAAIRAHKKRGCCSSCDKCGKCAPRDENFSENK